jgi:5-methylcytosine-specific restriction endonuclease McrA
MKRIKQSEIKIYREQYWQENNGICPVCQELIDLKDAVLDHRHSDGYIRNTIHRFCNTFISHIENNQKRNKISPSQLTAILANFQTYVVTTKPILHPTHLSPEERQARTKKRAKARRAKK